MKLYRICKKEYPANDGVGAKLAGGRWNHKGTPMLYCAATASLCEAEVLVHSDAQPKGRVVIEIDVPDDLPIRTLLKKELPRNWKAAVAGDGTKDLGTQWCKSKESAICPFLQWWSHQSAIVFAKITFSAPNPFPFDRRLK